MSLIVFIFFFFKQKTAYEMRISDWSSDVCSSDLPVEMGLLDRIFERFALPLAQIGIESFVFAEVKIGHIAEQGRCRRLAVAVDEQDALAPDREILRQMNRRGEIGRESCREGVCQYV